METPALRMPSDAEHSAARMKARRARGETAQIADFRARPEIGYSSVSKRPFIHWNDLRRRQMRPQLVGRQIHVRANVRRRRSKIQQVQCSLEMVQGVAKHLLTTGLVARQSRPHYLHSLSV